jgi:ferredoxin
MAYVISRLCRDCVDGSCVEVCPVDAIVEHHPQGRASELPNQLFIHAEECICCAACVPECPQEAIFDEGDIPPAFAADVALNALTATRRDEFRSATERGFQRAESTIVAIAREGRSNDAPGASGPSAVQASSVDGGRKVVR